MALNLAPQRRAVEKLMNGLCVIVRDPKHLQTLNLETLELEDVTDDDVIIYRGKFYAWKGGLSGQLRQAQPAENVGEKRKTVAYGIAIPFDDRKPLTVGMTWKCLAAPDPHLVGKLGQFEDIEGGTIQVRRAGEIALVESDRG